MRSDVGNGQPTGWAASVNAASNQIPYLASASAPSATAAQVVIQPKSAAACQNPTPAAQLLLRPLTNPKHRRKY